jgi:hypothetical protein
VAEQVAADTALETAGAKAPVTPPVTPPVGVLAVPKVDQKLAAAQTKLAVAQDNLARSKIDLKMTKGAAQKVAINNKIKAYQSAVDRHTKSVNKLSAMPPVILGATPPKATGVITPPVIPAAPPAPSVAPVIPAPPVAVPRRAAAGILSAAPSAAKPTRAERAAAREKSVAPADDRANAIRVINKAFSDAQLAAKGAGGHGNVDQALTDRLVPILQNPKITQHLTKDELAAVAKVVTADPSTRIGRQLSRLPTWASTIATASGGGLGLVSGAWGLPTAAAMVAGPPLASGLGHRMRRGGSKALVESAKRALGTASPKPPPGISTNKMEDIYRVLRMFGGA